MLFYFFDFLINQPLKVIQNLRRIFDRAFLSHIFTHIYSYVLSIPCLVEISF